MLAFAVRTNEPPLITSSIIKGVRPGTLSNTSTRASSLPQGRALSLPGYENLHDNEWRWHLTLEIARSGGRSASAASSRRLSWSRCRCSVHHQQHQQFDDSPAAMLARLSFSTLAMTSAILDRFVDCSRDAAHRESRL